MPHKVQVQAATVAGLGESRVVEEVLFSEEQGIYSVLQECVGLLSAYRHTYEGLNCIPLAYIAGW